MSIGPSRFNTSATLSSLYENATSAPRPFKYETFSADPALPMTFKPSFLKSWMRRLPCGPAAVEM